MFDLKKIPKTLIVLMVTGSCLFYSVVYAKNMLALDPLTTTRGISISEPVMMLLIGVGLLGCSLVGRTFRKNQAK